MKFFVFDFLFEFLSNLCVIYFIFEKIILTGFKKKRYKIIDLTPIFKKNICKIIIYFQKSKILSRVIEKADVKYIFLYQIF